MSHAAVTLCKSHRVGSATAKAVLLILADYADAEFSSFASQKRIAAEAEITDRSVRNVLKDLEERGLIRRARRHRSDGSRTSDRIWLEAAAIEALPDVISDRPTGTSFRTYRNQNANLPEPVSAHDPSGDPLVDPSGDDEHKNQEPKPIEDDATTTATGSDLEALCWKLAEERLAEFRANGGSVVRPEPWLRKVARSPAILNEAFKRAGPPGSLAPLLANTLRDIDGDAREEIDNAHRQEAIA